MKIYQTDIDRLDDEADGIETTMAAMLDDDGRLIAEYADSYEELAARLEAIRRELTDIDQAIS